MAVIIIEKKLVLDEKANGNCDPIWDITEGRYYISMTEAAKHIGCTVASISLSIRKGSSIVKGHKLCPIEEMPLHATEIADAISKRDAKLQSIKALLN